MTIEVSRYDDIKERYIRGRSLTPGKTMRGFNIDGAAIVARSLIDGFSYKTAEEECVIPRGDFVTLYRNLSRSRKVKFRLEAR